MRLALCLAVIAALAAPARADAPLFTLNQSSLPFDLGPASPGNSPSRMANSPSAAPNSAANPANGSGVYTNSAKNPANEKRVIFTSDGTVVGYYAPSPAGVLNLFSLTGKRVAYRPKGSKSLYANDGRWCGTVAAAQAGNFAFGIVRACSGLF